MVTSEILQRQLEKYASLITNKIKTLGYVPEFITGEASTLANTRLLCQTRSIFFLVDYAKLTNDTQYLNYANSLSKVILDNYLCQTRNIFLQYPVYVTEQTTTNDKWLYELAFVICALAKLYQLNQDEQLIKPLRNTQQFISDYFYQDNFKRLNQPINGINQNSLMHTFEAFLELGAILNDTSFKTNFVNFATDLLEVIYDNNANLIRENSLIEIYEPGHNFEWASLLLEAQQKDLFHTAKINYYKLVEKAETIGLNPNGLVYPQITLNAPTDDSLFRIWPLLEQIRYYAMTKTQDKLMYSLKVLTNNFFSADDLPYEYIDAQLIPQQTQVKATTGYHIINCYKYIL